MDVCRLGAHMAVEHSVLRAIYEHCMHFVAHPNLDKTVNKLSPRDRVPMARRDSLTAADPLTAETRLSGGGRRVYVIYYTYIPKSRELGERICPLPIPAAKLSWAGAGHDGVG